MTPQSIQNDIISCVNCVHANAGLIKDIRDSRTTPAAIAKQCPKFHSWLNSTVDEERMIAGRDQLHWANDPKWFDKFMGSINKQLEEGMEPDDQWP